ncbi:zinc-binding dehydrogenase [Amycolatopsis methanolica]|uniref:Alcohol dehydrogenase zinc-binding domain-containing protein n=1 Tax=Amycolatopsis methanolica 239 TaxID=1068978 RepID=A0A076MIX5_AMYME|nr:alcohol dehydrogenase zinc-binding domain-containing protein [Amycolatopsis methanolica 239]
MIGTARAVNHEFLRALGADELIDHTAVDFTTAVSDVDVVFDLVGGEYGTRSLRVLNRDGVLTDAQGDDGVDDSRYRRFYVQPSAAELARATDVRIHVSKVLPLADAAKAHELSESGWVRGKIVLVP